MSIQKLKYGDEFIYIDNSKVDINDTGIVVRDNDETQLDKSKKDSVIEKELLEDTITNLKGIKDYD